MAEPSLGQALGLNVERKDIFAPAAKQLAVNLASFAEKKERKAKAREDQYNKFLDEIIGLRKTSMHVREQANYDAAVNELKKELDDKFNSGADQRSLAESFFNFYDKQSLIKKRSDMLLEDQKSAFQNPSVVNSRVAAKIYRTGEELTPEDVIEAQAMGIDYNPDTREIMSRRIQYTSIPETIKNIKFDKAEADAAMAFMTEEQKKLASMTPAEQAIYKGRKIPGFTQKVTEVTRPSQALYEMKVDTFLNSDKGYTESALQEIESNLPQGQTIASVIKKKQEDLKADNNGVEPTLDLVKKSLAKDHFMSMYDNWARENAVSDEFQRAPVGGGGDGKGGKPANVAAVSPEYQYMPGGYQKALEYAAQFDKTPEQVLSIYEGSDTTSLSEEQRKQLIAAINKSGMIASGPSVSMQTLGAEKITIDGNPYNTRKLWYNQGNKKFYLIVDKQVSGEGTSVSISQETLEMTPKMMKDLVAAGDVSSSVKNQLENWNKLAGPNKWPTTDEYILRTSGSSRRPSGATTQSSGKKKKVF